MKNKWVITARNKSGEKVYVSAKDNDEYTKSLRGALTYPTRKLARENRAIYSPLGNEKVEKLNK